MRGKMVHVEIPADETQRAREFWGPLFGWQFEAFPGPNEYWMTRITDDSGAAVTNMEPRKRGLRVYFDVEDVNGATARVRELGGEADEPMPVPSMGWFVVCKDNVGNEFGLWQTDPSAPTPTG